MVVSDVRFEVLISFADAFWIIREAAAMDPSLYGQKYVAFVLSKMRVCDEGVLLGVDVDFGGLPGQVFH